MNIKEKTLKKLLKNSEKFNKIKQIEKYQKSFPENAKVYKI